jgi:hypothetical protein
MTISSILTIMGILVSAGFGMWGVYLSIKKRSYPAEISYILEDSIGLFDEVIGSLKFLTILYQEQPIKHNLVLLKGHLANTGSKDVSPAMVHQELTARLPENFKWIEANETKASRGVESSINIIEENILSFDLGHFRCGEYISFQALAEVPVSGFDNEGLSMLLNMSLKWDHRIMDTGQIKERKLQPDRSDNRMALTTGIFFLFCLIIPVLILSNIAPKTYDILFEIPSETGPPILVTLSPKSEEVAKLKGVYSEFEKRINYEDLHAKYGLNVSWKQNRGDRIINNFFAVIFPILGTLVLILFLIIHMQIRKNKKIRQIIKS